MIFFAAAMWLRPIQPVALLASFLIVHFYPAAYVAVIGNRTSKTR
jgi:hypothetical protein